MMNKNHTSKCGHVLTTFLLMIGLFSLFTIPASAEFACGGQCESYLTQMNHEIPEGDTSLCETPIANFCGCVRVACAPHEVEFTDWSIGCIDTWEWDFGDPNSGSANYSNDENPTHTYSLPGIYTVTLTITGANGSSTKVKEDYVTIRRFPYADFIVSNLSGCAPVIVQFENRSFDAVAYLWDFGDGTTSTEVNPTHEYATSGTYTVTLAALNECGKFKKPHEIEVVIEEGPTADFSADQTDFCVGGEVQFTDLSLLAESWLWDFGDSTSSTDQHPLHAYPQPGTYTVSLTVLNPCGDDTETKIQYITVKDLPIADFSADKETACIEEDIQFTDLSTNAISVVWQFGDGETSTDRDPIHSYGTYGFYNVTLIATGECGVDTLTKLSYIHVLPNPTPEFSAKSQDNCLGIPTDFTYEGQYATTWAWDFGDGETSSVENPSHTYRQSGVYSITLTVTNSCGSDSLTKEEYITIYDLTVAEFFADNTNICEGDTVSFTNESEFADSYSWNFGDGTTSTDENPSHAYSAEGDYTVSLQAFGICGDPVEEKTEYIHVAPPPVASFRAEPKEGCQANIVDIDNESEYGDTFDWYFGDGTTSSDPSPGSHTYADTGYFDITLIVTNDCGTDTAWNTVYIPEILLPTADFVADKLDICYGDTVNFTNLSTNAGHFHWSFGDGGTSSATDPSHTYTSPGHYTVELYAGNDCGDDTETKEYYIIVRGDPIADFYTYSDEFCTGEEIEFNDVSQDARTWSWDFGDGGTSIDQYPRHTYTTPGVYTISLTVTNACGEDTETREEYITIYPAPIADFGTEVTGYCLSDPVYFYDRSTYADTWHWDFGDGNTSDDRNPTHTYAATGVYTISLRVTNDCGDDTEIKTDYIIILDEPVADFTSDNRRICTGSAVSFFDNSYYGYIWAWDFGDGNTSPEQNPVHTYTTAGVYAVSLTITNPCGSDTETKQEFITVYQAPIADFNMEVNRGCINTDMYFYDASQYADTWEWDFGDGSPTSPTRNPTHQYADAGVYTITLKVTNDCGEDTYTQVDYVTIFDGPAANFEATPRSGGAPLQVAFTDQSTTAFTILSWDWDFGDGNTSTAQHPNNTYTAAGLYTVSLTVTDQCGPNTVTKTEYIEVTDSCDVDFYAEPTEGCGPLSVSFGGFTIGSCDITAWTWDFGDPASGNDNAGTGQYVDHIYADAGTYTVTLTATDTDGDIVKTKPQYITVYGEPIADFRFNPQSGSAPLTVGFMDMSTTATGTITGYGWNFGDPASGMDNTSTDENAIHIYASDGVYTITHVVFNECYPDTITKQIMVGPAISVIKEVDRTFAREGDNLVYTIRVQNIGSEAIGNIIVNDTIPEFASYVPGSADNGGLYDANDDRVAWSIPVIQGGGEEVMTFSVLLDGPFVTYPTTVTNIANATFDDENTFATELRTVISNPVQTVVDIPLGGDLGVLKQVDATLASPGDILTYTITVINERQEVVTNVRVYDAIPDSTSYVAGSISSGGFYNAATDSLYWNLGSLNPFEIRVVSFQVVIDGDVPDNIQIPNTALVLSSLGGDESNQVITEVSIVPLVIKKTTSTPSGMVGDLMRFTITIENFSGEPFTDVELIDTMPGGIFYIDGTTMVNGTSAADPVGDNPLTWTLGDLPTSGVFTVEYSALVSASAYPGMNENVARSTALQGIVRVNSNRAVARIYILGQTLSGAIRGRIIVDCDGDGIADMDSVPSGMDVYLDDGSHSKVNEKGMFYFSTVRPGERVVALDERDLNAYYIPEDAQASVFVHVHETGESYVNFRVCPEYAKLDIHKKAAIIPMVKVTKTATLHADQATDSLGVLVDYQIDIESNGLSDPTAVKIIDSFPDNTLLILNKKQVLEPKEQEGRLVYEITTAQERMYQSAYYSLKDLAPGVRRFMTNKIYLESESAQFGDMKQISSAPAEVNVGPFLLVPPQDVKVTLTPALFITSLADLQEPAIPQLHAVADSILKYADADIKVEGHTDYRPINTPEFPSNWELGEARAKTVVDWLVANREVAADRLKYESFAATKPVVDIGTTSEELQPNRRTEVIIQTKVAGYVNPDLLHPETWTSSTALALKPMKYDTLFEVGHTPIEIDLDDTWEVILVIENTSAIASESVSLTDIIPDNAEYLSGSAVVDDISASPSVNGQNIVFSFDNIEPSQKIEVRYRIRALEDTPPTGGGAASIEVMTSQDIPVIQKSNEVSFK